MTGQLGCNAMDYHGVKNTINRFLVRHAGEDERPVFFNTDGACPALRHLEEAYPRIRAEADALLARRVPMPRYHEVNPPARAISDTTPGHWNVFLLELLGYPARCNQALCPETTAALKKVPGRLQAFFSVLDPGKSIPLHDGPYIGYLRYHLGVRIPRDRPSFIRVAGREYAWKDGEGVVFDDSWPHEVVNHSAEPRVVLIVDIPRPLPLMADLVNKTILWGIAAPLYARKVMRKAEAYSGDIF